MENRYNSQITIEDFIVLTTTATLHNLFSYEKGSDAVALYLFYYYTAKWQKTNQVKATSDYTMKGLRWGRDKFSQAKKILLESKLVEDITHKDKAGKVNGWYIKINFIWKTEKGDQVVAGLLDKKTTLRKSHRVVKPDTNALSKNKINASSKDIISIFEYWNKQKIISHKKLTGKMKTKISYSLKEYSKGDIMVAIKKYKVVLAGKEYFWTYEWTLAEFLQRGLTKFLDTPTDNFKTSQKMFAKPKKRRVYFQGDPVYEKNGKQYVVQNGEWREFVGDEKDLIVKFK